jgi:hypothetical protein
MIALSRMESVELRRAWTSEAGDFTPWLAQPDNIALLGRALGIELDVEGQERGVGPFRADILCRDTADGSWVLIENQLERTDHLHLGQLITYAAGLEAVTVVWIAQRFTEEHRAALDWLNRITAESIRFFGIEIELWKIAESPPAPRFNIVAKPNDWARQATLIKTDAESGRALVYKAYWQALLDYQKQHRHKVRIPSAPKVYWANVGIGRSGMSLVAWASLRDKRIGVNLWTDTKQPRELLRHDRAEIDATIGEPVDWNAEWPGSKGAKIQVIQANVDPSQQSDWPSQHRWLATMLDRFDAAFRGRVSKLVPQLSELQDVDIEPPS